MALEAQPRELRGRILKILNINYPEAISDRVMVTTLQEIEYHVTYPTLYGHVQYLTEKGYSSFEKVEHKALSLPMWMIKLTAKGKDLLEGSVPADPGVQL